MRVVDKTDTNAFLMIGWSEQLYYGPDEDLSGKGEVAHPRLWAWLRIRPVAVPEMSYVIGGTDVSWGHLEPTLSERVECASRLDATLLAEKSPFGTARRDSTFEYLVRVYPEDRPAETSANGLSIPITSTDGENTSYRAPENKVVYVASCVPMETITHLSARADEKGLLIPVSQQQLAGLSASIMLRREQFQKKGGPIELDMRANIQQEGASITLRFGISLDLCQFAQSAMKEFSEKLIAARRARLKKFGQRVIGGGQVAVLA